MDEAGLRRRLAAGELVDLRTAGARSGAEPGAGPGADREDPSDAASWGADREVPAELLVELLTTEAEEGTPSTRGRHLRLAGARITGVVDLTAAVVTRRIELTDCALPDGMVLTGAELIGLYLYGCHVGEFHGEGLTCGGDLFLGDGFSAPAGVRLASAQIGGRFSCRDARLGSTDGIALSAEHLSVRDTVSLDGRFHAHGTVNLSEAEIGSQLVCGGATLDAPGEIALLADGLEARTVFCNQGFTANGVVRLVGANLGGLIADGSRLHNPGGTALAADDIRVADNVMLHDFRADGAVRLVGARIEGQLGLRDGTVRHPEQVALLADNLVVDRGLAAEGLTVHGSVRLIGASIGRRASLDNVRLSRPAPDGATLDLTSAQIAEVDLRPEEFEGSLNLSSTTVTRWSDNRLARSRPTWLYGFSYQAIGDRRGSGIRDSAVDERLEWLERSMGAFGPQPYEQLATVLAEHGYEDAARRVHIAKQRRRRANYRNPLWRWPAMAWSWLLRITIGYGYRPWRVLWPLVILQVTGTALFGREYAAGRIVPTGEAPEAADFDAMRYTLDLLLPVIGLLEDSAYAAIDRAAWYAFGFTCAGWLLALILVAGLTGILERSKPR